MTVPAGQVERGVVVTIARVDFCAGRDKFCRGFEVTVAAGFVERSLAAYTLVYFCARCEQTLDFSKIADFCGGT